MPPCAPPRGPEGLDAEAGPAARWEGDAERPGDAPGGCGSALANGTQPSSRKASFLSFPMRSQDRAALLAEARRVEYWVRVCEVVYVLSFAVLGSFICYNLIENYRSSESGTTFNSIDTAQQGFPQVLLGPGNKLVELGGDVLCTWTPDRQLLEEMWIEGARRAGRARPSMTRRASRRRPGPADAAPPMSGRPHTHRCQCKSA